MMRLAIIQACLLLAPCLWATTTTHQIAVHVLNSSNAPVSGVAVYATIPYNGANYQVNGPATDAGGNSILTVSNGYWSVGLNCDNLNNLFYSCVDPQSVSISGNNGVANFIVPELGAPELWGHIVDNNNGNPIANVALLATSPGYPNLVATTDANGFYEFATVGNGYWDVSVNCTNLNALGYACVNDQTNIGVGDANVGTINFAAQPLAGGGTPAFFTAQAYLDNHVFYLSASGHTFGYYSMLSFPYVYHFDLGFLYFFDANNASHGCYFYDFTSAHFWYTDPTLFPYLYDFSRGAWLYYFTGTTDQSGGSNKRAFVNMSNGQYIYD